MNILGNILKEKRYQENIKDFQEFSKEYQEQTILPRNIYELYDYDGDYDRDYLYKNMKVFVDYLGYLKENINSSNCEELFNSNSEEITEILGIDDLDVFKTFIKSIKNKNLNLDEFKYAEIEKGTSYRKNQYFHFVLYLYYGENNEIAKFNVSFSENENNKKSVIYECINE